MKIFNSCFILLCSLFLMGSINNLQAQDQSYFELEVKNIAPKEIKFINNSNLEVKVILYNDGDNVMAVGLKSFTVKAGKSASYKYGVYNVKIFKPQVFDKHLLTQKNVSGNLQISGTQSKLSAKRLTARKNTEFKNSTGEEIKICLYTKGDIMKTIPFAVYTLKDNTSTASYNGDERSFFVSVFKPGILDMLLVSQICPDQSIITVKKVN
jgi:hypothetical protein